MSPVLNYRVEVIESAPFAENSYIVWRPEQKAAVVVDPGFDVPAILRVIEREQLRVALVFNTHGHADHIAGNAALLRAHPSAPLVIGRNDAALLTDPEANLSAGFGVALTSPPANQLLDEGEVNWAGLRFEIREVPGHSPGSVVAICRDFDPWFVIGGDVLFAGSIGRTDLAYGDGPLLIQGIRTKLFDLPDSTEVWPGHGPTTTIGRERRVNPFVGDNPGLYRVD